jgi:hypothetical protein
MKYDFGDPGAWNFSARMVYDKSGRTYALDFNRRYNVDVDHNGSGAFGGPAVTIETSDGMRSCMVAVGLHKFTETFFESWTRFCRLDVTYSGNGETAEERLDDRNQFLREASKSYPALLSETRRQIRALDGEIDEALARLTSLKVVL